MLIFLLQHILMNLKAKWIQFLLTKGKLVPISNRQEVQCDFVKSIKESKAEQTEHCCALSVDGTSRLLDTHTFPGLSS
jgi:hypothetical protein